MKNRNVKNSEPTAPSTVVSVGAAGIAGCSCRGECRHESVRPNRSIDAVASAAIGTTAARGLHRPTIALVAVSAATLVLAAGEKSAIAAGTAAVIQFADRAVVMHLTDAVVIVIVAGLMTDS